MKNKKVLALSLAILCFCLSACNSTDYKMAESLVAEGKYEEAIAAFNALGDFKDAKHRADIVSYDWARQLLNNGEWESAVTIAKGIDTSDSELCESVELLLLQCDLKKAEELLTAGKSKEALDICQKVKSETTNSSIIVAADNLKKKCQEVLSLGDVSKLLKEAQSEYEKKNWKLVVSLCTQISEIAPDTEVSATAKTLQENAVAEIESELTEIMDTLEDAQTKENWDEVIETATTILDEYNEFLDDTKAVEQYRNNAKQKQLEIANEKLGPALEKLNKEYDEVEATTWYMPDSEPRYINDYCVSYLYIGERENRSPWLRWRTIYVADEWLYFDELIINVDGKVFSVNCNYDDTVRDSNRRNYWEYVDFQPKFSQLDIVRAIIESESTVIRFSNNDEDKIYDYTVSQKEKDGFRDVLEAFELMQYRE